MENKAMFDTLSRSEGQEVIMFVSGTESQDHPKGILRRDGGMFVVDNPLESFRFNHLLVSKVSFESTGETTVYLKNPSALKAHNQVHVEYDFMFKTVTRFFDHAAENTERMEVD